MIDKRKKSCGRMVKNICDSLGESSDSPQCRALKLHLEECPDCREYLRSIRTTISLYKEYPTPPLTPKDRHKLLRKLF
jgi:hypothetical protein